MRKLIAILLLLPNFAFAAIAIDSQAVNAVQGGSPNSFSFNNVAGTFLVVSTSGSGRIESVLYNGIALNLAASSSINGGQGVFYLVNPATGAHTLTVNSLGDDNYIGATSLTGVSTLNPLGATSTFTTATSTNPTFSFTTNNANSWVFDADTLYTNANGAADILTTGSGHTKVGATQQNSFSVMNGYTVATSTGTYGVGWSYPSAAAYAGAEAEFNAATSSGTTNNFGYYSINWW